MGYTHYWYTNNIHSYIHPGIRKNIIDELNKSIDILGYDRGLSYIYTNNDKIIIDNIDNEPTHNETFIFYFSEYQREEDPLLKGFHFCKTNRVPKFDMLVMITLLSLANNIHGFVFKTDGNINNWKPAIELYEKHIRYLTFNFEEMIANE